MNHASSTRALDDSNDTGVVNARARGRIVGGGAIALLFMGSTLLTPLYDLYRAEYGLSVLGLGLLYAVYVIGNLLALLFLARLSDQVGRRPVVLTSLALASVSTLLFLFATNPSWLFTARIINGLAVGLGSGAATAWISEFTPEAERAGAASVMTSFNFVGLALGTLLAGALAQYEPHPLRVPFEIYLLLLIVSLFVVGRTRETLSKRAASRIDLKPRIGVPSGVRFAFLAPAAGGFAAMAMVGFYAALGPTTIHAALHIDNRALSGLIVAELFVVAALVIVATTRMQPRTTMRIGLLTIPLGVALLVAAQRFGSLPLMISSAGISGLSAALGYRGGLAVVSTLTPPERRAEVASSYFVCCFLGNAVPVIGVTALSQLADADIASIVFAVVLAIIGIGAFCTTLVGSPSHS